MHQDKLENFKKVLLAKKNAILEHNAQHQSNVEQMRNTKGDEADYATMSVDNALEGSIFQKHHQELEYIERALEKIEKGVYGICEMCNDPIAIGRLKAKPYAKYCIVCREIVEKDLKDKV